MFLKKTNTETKVSKKIGNKCKRAKMLPIGKKFQIRGDRKYSDRCYLTKNYRGAGHRT